MIDDFLIGIFLSTLLGALVGIQREMRLQKEKYNDFAGFRTFTFISILGFLIGYISFNLINNSNLIVLSVFGFFLLLVASYIVLSKKYSNYVSETSQIVAMVVFLIGILISLKNYYISIVVCVLTTALLVLGDTFHGFAKRISKTEIFATIKFLIIAVIILPILPNQSYGFLDIPLLSSFLLTLFSYEFLLEFQIFNFYEIWLLVVFISSITYFGYIFMKVLGSRKGTILTGVLGGFMSSTALTISFANESKNSKHFVKALSAGIILASSIMFFRIILEVAVVNSELVSSLFFMSIIAIVGIILAMTLNRRKKGVITKEIKFKSPFTLIPAIKFGLFFVFIIFISKLFSIYFGSKGIYIIAFFSGLTDVDAITLSLARLAQSGDISNYSASLGIFIAAVSNTIVKGGIVYFLGSKELAKSVLFSFTVILVLGIILFLV